MLGFFFDQKLGGNGENLFLKQIPLPNADHAISYGSSPDKTIKENVDISLKGFLDSVDFSRFWSYSGSLTTPGCDEVVEWTVIDDIQPISAAQLKGFTDLWGPDGTARRVQPLNGRELHYVGPPELLEAEAAAAAAVTFGVLFGVFALILVIVLVIIFCKPSIFSLKKLEKAADAGNANKN